MKKKLMHQVLSENLRLC